MRLAQVEARRRGHNYVGTEHLLLGLVGLGEGSAACVLAETGGTAQQVQWAVDSMIPRGVPAGAP